MYKLTSAGSRVAEQIARVGDAESAFLAYLYEMKEPIEQEELFGETRVDPENGERVLSRLVSKGYIEET